MKLQKVKITGMKRREHLGLEAKQRRKKTILFAGLRLLNAKVSTVWTRVCLCNSKLCSFDTFTRALKYWYLSRCMSFVTGEPVTNPVIFHSYWAGEPLSTSWMKNEASSLPAHPHAPHAPPAPIWKRENAGEGIRRQRHPGVKKLPETRPGVC